MSNSLLAQHNYGGREKKRKHDALSSGWLVGWDDAGCDTATLMSKKNYKNAYTTVPWYEIPVYRGGWNDCQTVV